MKRPVLIGIIIAVAVVLLGYFLFTNNDDDVDTTTGTDTSQTTPAEDTDTDNIPQQDDTTPAQEASAVTIQDGSFGPTSVTVARGTTVTWTNQGSQQHTVTPDTETAEFQDSGMLSNGETYSVTFNTPGTYTYHCTPHPDMVGTIVVTE